MLAGKEDGLGHLEPLDLLAGYGKAATNNGSYENHD